MKMKNIFLLVGVLALCFGLCACAKNDASASDMGAAMT